MKNVIKNIKYLIPFTLGIITVFIICALTTNNNVNSNSNIKYGMPSTKDDFVINRSQYVIGYNKSDNRANWVSWELNNSWIGSAIRTNIFVTDDSLPTTYTKITSNDYTGSGYDRGHMANSDDRSNTQENNDKTFILSNIVPQSPDNNRGPWKYLEQYCRTIVKANKNLSLYIVSGPIGGTNKLKGKVTIPSSLFKTVLIEENSKPIKGFAVVMPNVNGIVNNNWKQYITSIRQVESLTKFDFYNTLDKKTQDLIELIANPI